MDLTIEQEKALILARARARRQAAEAQAEGKPWERFRQPEAAVAPDQERERLMALARARKRAAEAGLKPWEIARRQQEEAGLKPWQRDWSQPQAPEAQPDLKPWELARKQAEGSPDPAIAAYTAEVMSGDPARAQAAVVKDEFGRMPAWQWPLVAADGLTFGLADTLGGYLSEATGIGPTREERRRNTEDARSRSGLAGTAAEMLGGAKTLGALPGTSPTQMVRNKRLAARLAAGGVEGAAVSALTELGHEREVDGTDLLTGAVSGAGGQAVASGASKLADALGQGAKRLTGQVPKVPSQDELRRASAAAFKEADEAGVMFTRKGMDRLKAEVVDDLGTAYDPDISPKVAKILKRLDNATPTLTELKNIRQLTREWYDPTGKKDITNRLLLKVRGRIDRFIEGAGEDDLISGDNKAAAAALDKARSLWARAEKSERVEDIIEEAANRQGPERATRTMIGKLPERMPNLTPDELASANDVAQGTLGRNLVAYTGRALAPQSGALGTAASTAAAVSGLLSGYPSAAAVPVLGAGAKMLSDRITKRKAQRLAELMRAGGTREALRGPDNLPQRLAKTKRDLLARLLMTGAISYAPALAQ
ncbi:hypothetical protein DC522_14445 [Microvirga sp. KLBC 81]|uniref:hypothetical protein n=1 Tax=Microvirga sp. KLBC 81 TaxID=1862707 RepID=UPI000D52191A|nr:hypothetical protein [Microvirga sp. KLBC 81]PVE23647.1 hypothetical protein DC522_14445 [Microvirga sp. KLBC 81]